MDERLQKVLADAGISSRRAAEKLILDGRVKVNGTVVSVLGYKVSPKDSIYVDDKLITKQEKKYFLMNKPDGYICVTNDHLGRKNIFELIREEDFDLQLHSVGRLDFHAQGLLLVTNDGALTQKLTKKDVRIKATYQVRVSGIVLKALVREMRKGFLYHKTHIRPFHVAIIELDKTYKTTLLEIVLDQGHGPAIKDYFLSLKHPVKKLTRIKYGDFDTDGIQRGDYRTLKIHEVKKLLNRN